jgi:hypothetical protein
MNLEDLEKLEAAQQAFFDNKKKWDDAKKSIRELDLPSDEYRMMLNILEKRGFESFEFYANEYIKLLGFYKQKFYKMIDPFFHDMYCIEKNDMDIFFIDCGNDMYCIEKKEADIFFIDCGKKTTLEIQFDKETGEFISAENVSHEQKTPVPIEPIHQIVINQIWENVRILRFLFKVFK